MYKINSIIQTMSPDSLNTSCNIILIAKRIDWSTIRERVVGNHLKGVRIAFTHWNNRIWIRSPLKQVRAQLGNAPRIINLYKDRDSIYAGNERLAEVACSLQRGRDIQQIHDSGVVS